jgi:SAM-dependent methyltransferase
MNAAHEVIAQQLAATGYQRERLDPQPGDPLYLHLADLRRALETVRTDAPVRVLDYGCGSSPYRSLFPGADYRRADFLDTGDLDYRLDEDSRVPEIDASFDLILSTQVLEHVAQPAAYLRECLRLLKPGGRLVLTTHGLFEDHGCPYDFQRWTADGLRLALVQAGFKAVRLHKLTTGPRAVLMLMDQSAGSFHSPTAGFGLRVLLAIYRRGLIRFRAALHRAWDRAFAACPMVPADEPGHALYIGLLVEAVRP